MYTTFRVSLQIANFYTDFEQWKTQYEHETNSSFVKSTGSKVLCDVKKVYYYCNRSGYFNPRGQQHRSLKSQGTAKIDSYCTAGMVVTIEDRSIEVSICTTHYGHQISLGHIRLSKEYRYSIAAKVSQGVTFQRILDDIRDDAGKLSRLHLTTRQDIHNIERCFGLRAAQKHKNDAVSVEIWVKEMRKASERNPVLLYKPQDSDPDSKCPSLKSTDFILVLQTPMQREMLLKFGANVICMDDTHGTNSYDFNLISIVVVDEFGEGCPVGWCLCNRVDMYIMIDFLMAVKENVGSIKPCWVMTDDAEQYFKAWVAVFGMGPCKLLCTWHVDRAWRKVLNDKETAALVYHNIRLLMEESNVTSFLSMLKETLAQLIESPATAMFGSYFEVHYAKRCEEWAACYRKSANINTNMYVESIHRCLKHVYMKGRINKRVDNLLYILMKISRDKAFDRLCKLQKGKISGRLTTIRKRHWESTKLSYQSMVTISKDGKEWNVKSADGRQEYSVVCEHDACQQKCQIATAKYVFTCTHVHAWIFSYIIQYASIST